MYKIYCIWYQTQKTTQYAGDLFLSFSDFSSKKEVFRKNLRKTSEKFLKLFSNFFENFSFISNRQAEKIRSFVVFFSNGMKTLLSFPRDLSDLSSRDKYPPPKFLQFFREIRFQPFA